MNIADNGAAWFYTHVWDASSATREAVQNRIDYFNGRHAILDESSTYANGQPKGQRVMNWIREIVMRHVGSMTPFQVTRPAGDVSADDAEQQDPYQELAASQRLYKTDKLLIRDALLCGYGVEFQQFDNGAVEIIRYDPTEWAFLWEDDRVLKAAVRLVTYDVNSVMDGKIVETTTHRMYVYTEEEVGVYTSESSSVWTGEAEANVLGRIPVVVWTADESRNGIITDALIAANDEYNAAWNLQGDDIRNTVDAILIMYGVDSAWVKDNEDAVRYQRTIPFDDIETQRAEYLARALDIEPHIQHLMTTRENIHIMGSIPDVLRIVGASGAASGIALKLMFTPMAEAFDGYSSFLTDSVRARIALLNERWQKLDTKGTYESPDVRLQFRVPTNRIEEWQNIAALKGIVSHGTMLELLSDIEDPEAELQNITNEMGEDTHEAVAQRTIENEKRMAQLEGQLLQEAERTTEAVASVVEALRGAIIERSVEASE